MGLLYQSLAMRQALFDIYNPFLYVGIILDILGVVV